MNNQILQYCNKHMLKHLKFETVMRVIYSKLFKDVVARRNYYIGLNRAYN